MSHATWKKRGCLLGLLGLTAAVALVPIPWIIWDGGFDPAEYRLKFIYENGQPIPGVGLRVLTRAGGECHFYPIDEYLPDRAPTTNADGRMVFHHAGKSLEFGGRESRNLLGMRFGETKAPQYVCVFSVNGLELHRVRYDDLRPRGDSDRWAKVTRLWQNPEWPSQEYAAHHDNWSAHVLKLFDGNGDRELDREERTAAGYFGWAMDRKDIDHRGRDLEFLVVERTITVSIP